MDARRLALGLTLSTGLLGGCQRHLELHELDDPQAICNDGTPAGYYYRPGKSSRWLIYLEGGGFCDSVEECDARTMDLQSSSGWPEELNPGGIFATDEGTNPDFHDAHHVFLKYCSSDLWSGDRAAAPETGDRHFRGSRILEAALDDLIDQGYLEPSAGLDVLFAGTSAGGVGVLINLDRVKARLSPAKVRGLDDAGWLVDIPPFDPALGSYYERATAGVAFWGARVDESCASEHPGDLGLCYLGEIAVAALSAPIFIHVAQQDIVLLGYLGVDYPYLGDRAQYVNCTFGPAVRDSIADLDATFSPVTWLHGLLTLAFFNSVKVDEHSQRTLLSSWLSGSGTTHAVEVPDVNCP
ncbi:MAG: hypothetical protein H6711_05395 [Myxococcales bacterium]|nr:hypothetical protein [Myxococcales bacterium]